MRDQQYAGVAHLLSYLDILLAPVYFFLLLFIVRRWKKKRYSNSPIGKYIVPAFVFKAFCCVLLALLYDFFYKAGDPHNYYTGVLEIWEATKASPQYGLELIFKPFENCSPEAMQFAYHLSYGFSPDVISMFKMAGFLGIFCFGTYLPLAFVISFLSFVGTWKIFLVFYKEFPAYHKTLAIACFFMPSAIIWGTNVLKDPLCIFGLGLCFSGLYNLLKGRFGLLQLAEAFLGGFVLFHLKIYIFFAFCISAGCALCIAPLLKINNKLFKRTVRTGIFLLLFSLGTWAYYTQRESVTENFIAPIAVTQNTQMQAEGGSTYVITDIDANSPWGIIRTYFLSLNVALFRPYPWEITSPIVILSAMEAAVIFVITLYLLIKLKITGFFKPAFKNPVMLFALVFTLLLAPLTGFVAFNFGTLARYKIPFVPFYYSYLAVLFMQTKKSRESVTAVAV
jgi:predicted ribosomally synthesized peptide with SipW-like signal peptide